MREFLSTPFFITKNSNAFSAAINAIAHAGGGTLQINNGVYLTGPSTLFSNMSLEIGQNASLCFIPDIYLYSPVLTRWEGIVCYGMHPLIFARDAHHITLRGEGIIDGNGTLWWDTLKRKKREHQDKPIESFEVALAKLNHYVW